MKKLYKKGKRIHPSLSSIDDQYFSNVLPATILTLIGALSFDDKQVLAYLISCSNNSKNNTQKGTKKLGDAINNGGGDHAPAFNCDCFRCYKCFWARWDASPNRQLIHEIIEAYEEDLIKKNKFLYKDLKIKKRDRRRGVARVCDEPSDGVDVDLGSGKGLMKELEIEAVQESPAGKVDGDVAGNGDDGQDDDEVASEKGSTLKRLFGFIDKVSAVWNFG